MDKVGIFQIYFDESAEMRLIIAIVFEKWKNGHVSDGLLIQTNVTIIFEQKTLHLRKSSVLVASERERERVGVSFEKVTNHYLMGFSHYIPTIFLNTLEP